MAFSSPDGRTMSSLAEINITPMVDVMLVLLVIFMVTTPIIQSGIDVNLPRTTHVRQQTARQQHVITVDQKENLFFMTREINLFQLGSAVKTAVRGDLRQPIYLRADGDVRFDVVVKVMDELRKAGFTNLQIVTRPLVKKKNR